ncbi:hypothetical protein TYRP_014693 [Tyrophagus putrescentiae]|nr:hypothetical protein TYRP_014693 [Tyrophagus putrescentiae]
MSAKRASVRGRETGDFFFLWSGIHETQRKHQELRLGHELVMVVKVGRDSNARPSRLLTNV